MRAVYGLAVLIALSACGGDSTTSAPAPSAHPTPTQPTAASISIDQHGFFGRILLDVKEQASLTATVRDASGAILNGHTVTWLSSAPSVATVSSVGLVTGFGQGTTTITATSDGKVAGQEVQVIPLNLTSYQLSVLVKDDAGNPVLGASVENVYYGARLPGCLSCNIPYGNYVAGFTDAAGSFTGHFVADPEGLNGWAGGLHAYAYVVAHRTGYETDRRFVMGTPTSFTQPVLLRAIKQVSVGDSVALTIASTDPVFQELDTSPAEDGTFICRTFLLVAPAGGVLTVTASATGSGAAPLVELDLPDESDFLGFGTGSASTAVHAGDTIEVRIATHVRPGDQSLSFVVRSAVAK